MIASNLCYAPRSVEFFWTTTTPVTFQTRMNDKPSFQTSTGVNHGVGSVTTPHILGWGSWFFHEILLYRIM